MKRFFQHIVFAVAVFCICGILYAAEKPVELAFDGKPVIGETYVMYFHTIRTSTYSMKPVGLANAPQHKETNEIHASGEIIYDSLSPFVARFKITEMEQILDGEKTDFRPLAGATAVIRESGVNLRDIPVGSDRSAESVLGGNPVTGAAAVSTAEIRALVPKAKKLLNQLLSAPSDDAARYLGTSKKAAAGESWKVSAAPILAAVKEQGMTLPEQKVSSTARYTGPIELAGIGGQNVYFLAESENVPGYDFKLEITFTFPKNGGDPPMRMERSATEFVNRVLPEGIPGFSGTTFDCLNQDQTDLVILRKSKIKDQNSKKKDGWFFGLF